MKNKLKVKYIILSLMTEERTPIVNQNIQKFPFIEIFESINGYDKEKTIKAYRDSQLQYRALDSGFETYGTLANFLTKYNALKYQIKNKIPYMCFLEDDLELHDNFIEYTEKLIKLFHNDYIKILRLKDFGEGYITNLNGANEIVKTIQTIGIVDNIDNQLRLYSGTELHCHDTPFRLVVPTNQGDCLKTDTIDLSDLNIIEHFYEKPELGDNSFDYQELYDYFSRIIQDNGHIVEIGSRKGKSSAYLAVNIINSNKKIKFDCIDVWKSFDARQNIKNDTLYELFLKNIEPVNNIINPIRMNSVEASQLYKNNTIDIVFLDACYTYESVTENIKAWLPKIKEGGIIGGYNYSPSSLSVVNAVNDYFNEKIMSVPKCSSWIYHNK